MGRSNLINDLNIDSRQLDEKKQQTDYKIKYIVEYIRRWLLVNTHREQITDLNFVDCMCNAGVYKDGDLCTAMEVLTLFDEAAEQFPDKNFNIFVNDYNVNRLEICLKVADKLICVNNRRNLRIYSSILDVNEYLSNFSLFDRFFGFGGATVAFVDPYDFGTVKIAILSEFSSRYYCEVIFNLFTSDFIRNGVDNRIRNCIGNATISNKEELIEFVVRNLKVGKMQHVFSYQFKTSTNVELYQIFFATPSKKGLEVLKEALWETFNGKLFHRNFEDNPMQTSMFSEEQDRDALLCFHASIAKGLLLAKFGGQKVDYKQIDIFLMENTMLRNTDFINNVLKPLIEKGYVKKQGIPQNKLNYKDDEYVFVKETNT